MTHSTVANTSLNLPSFLACEDLQQICQDFLKLDERQRLSILQQIGLARYDFLIPMPLSEANIACVMRLFSTPSQAKFPDLRGADLSGLNLAGVNFIRGNLTGTNLQGSCLSSADLLFANLTNADLRGADLRGATLNETVWLGTRVEGCHLGKGIGLTKRDVTDLTLNGGIFER
ncbi:pentapeptide repeat-containing protein [Lusitaniella coriacea]|uniref:pentapeptide repeat-containing protein n=1 Tax=Lusitaniella coriacea TaxID=1983105 RepID=UPI003CF0EB00